MEVPTTASRKMAPTQLVPAISLRYWKEGPSNGPGTGKTLTCCYSQMDAPFDRHWKILYGW
jgi:hypothetical protein